MHVSSVLNKCAVLYCSIVIVTGTVGNALVLVVFIARWARLKTYETFMLVLAAVDLIGTLVAPTFFVLESVKVNKVQTYFSKSLSVLKKSY